MDLPLGTALHDPDDWINWWLDLHPSDHFYGHLPRLALERMADASSLGSPGMDVLVFSEEDEAFLVEVRYLVEEYPGRGRVFHVLSIRSEGDPFPPLEDG